jgi:hypothetical protein
MFMLLTASSDAFHVWDAYLLGCYHCGNAAAVAWVTSGSPRPPLAGSMYKYAKFCSSTYSVHLSLIKLIYLYKCAFALAMGPLQPSGALTQVALACG